MPPRVVGPAQRLDGRLVRPLSASLSGGTARPGCSDKWPAHPVTDRPFAYSRWPDPDCRRHASSAPGDSEHRADVAGRSALANRAVLPAVPDRHPSAHSPAPELEERSTDEKRDDYCYSKYSTTIKCKTPERQTSTGGWLVYSIRKVSTRDII